MKSDVRILLPIFIVIAERTYFKDIRYFQLIENPNINRFAPTPLSAPLLYTLRSTLAAIAWLSLHDMQVSIVLVYLRHRLLTYYYS